MRLIASALFAAIVAGCAADPVEAEGPQTETSGNQPICLEARARVSAQCKGAPLPSFDDACADEDRCRAGCIYDHPCKASEQEKCFAEKC